MRVQTFKNLIGNQFFTATFIKKDGSERVMNARLGVKKHLNPTSKGRSDYAKKSLKDKGLVSVFDMGKQGYRTLNLNTVKKVVVDGTVLNFQ